MKFWPEAKKASGLNFLDRVSWLEHWTVEQTTELISIALGSGETEAIQLAKQLPNSRLLLDDHRARRVAEDLNLEIIGSAGILVQAKRKLLIREVVPILKNYEKEWLLYWRSRNPKGCTGSGRNGLKFRTTKKHPIIDHLTRFFIRITGLPIKKKQKAGTALRE